MPVCFTEEVSENTVLAVWKIVETRDELLGMLKRYSEEDSRKDQLHWLASRAAILSVFGANDVRLVKDEYNKPALEVDGEAWHVSITHSFAYAAVIISKLHPVGIDLEKLDDRIFRVAAKFTGEEEAAFASTGPVHQLLTAIWSAKETMYKVYGKKELDFRTQLFVKPFAWTGSRLILDGELKKEDVEMKLRVTLEVMDDYILTWTA